MELEALAVVEKVAAKQHRSLVLLDPDQVWAATEEQDQARQ
jgi:hypothetical protein